MRAACNRERLLNPNVWYLIIICFTENKDVSINNDTKEEALNTLQVVHVQIASEVASADWFSGSDPYFIGRIGSKGSTWEEKGLESGMEFRSETIQDTEVNVEWNAKFSFDPLENWVLGMIHIQAYFLLLMCN